MLPQKAFPKVAVAGVQCGFDVAISEQFSTSLFLDVLRLQWEGASMEMCSLVARSIFSP